MIRNVRTLVANSVLAVRSRAPETGGPTSAAVPAPLAAVRMVVGGGDAEFATSVRPFRTLNTGLWPSHSLPDRAHFSNR